MDEAIELGLKEEKAKILMKFGKIKSSDINILKQEYVSVLQEIGMISRDIEEISDVIKSYFKLFESKIKNIEFDLGLVRGMDYYDGYVFEIVDLNNKEIGSIAGGGEYTRLIKSFSGPDNLSAIGIAGGIERTMESIDENQEKTNNLISIISLLEEGAEDLIDILRDNNIPTTYRQLDNEDIKKGLKFASVNNANIAIIIGKNELAGGKYRVKDMKTGKEELVKKESVVDFIKELI